MIVRRLAGVLFALFAVLAAGVAGYMAIEDWNFFDSLYMTVITVASVGYGEINPLSVSGRTFTIILILCGSGTLIYGLSVLTAFIVEGELTDALRRRKMKKRIAGLVNHYIVCGAGSTGKHLVDELVKTRQDFVVVDSDPETVRSLVERGLLCLQGDATHEHALNAANIRTARGLVTSLHTDADNLLAVVTARGLRPDLKIISKAVDDESERKLRQVGADGVVMPNFIGGLRMASELIRPSVVSFLDIMLRSRDVTTRVEEISLSAASPFAGKSLADTGILDQEGMTVVALRSKKGEYLFNPRRERKLAAEDVLIVMGNVDCIVPLKRQAEAHLFPQE